MPPESEPADPNQRFRARRTQALKRRRHHRTAGLALLLIAAGLVVLGATVIGTRGHGAGGKSARGAKSSSKKAVERVALPGEVRGVHVTMYLASERAKLDSYLALPGLNTVELDVKDERGNVGFLMPSGTLPRRIGASQPYYNAGQAAGQARKAGVYLIGRIVTFEDPVLAAKRPDLAIRTRSGGVWVNNAGQGWSNPYDKRVWDYNIEIAKAAARAGFDEIQFDYVRFPSDGPIEDAVFQHKTAEPQGWTIARFLRYASTQLKPLGVRVSVDVFGLSATHDLGIGQAPRRLSKYVDAVYPMVYPSHYRSGEFNLPNPSAVPGTTVSYSLRDFRRALHGRHTMLIPWLEDFSLTSGSRPPEEVWAQIRAARRYHTRGFLLWNPKGVYTTQVLK